MRKLFFVTMLAALIVLMTAGAAMAAHSPVGDRTGWAEMSAQGCEACHDYMTKHTSGPHGGYTSTTNRCQACHEIHDTANASMLPGATVTAACNFCHDLTATDAAPYYATDLANPAYGADVKASHRVFGTVNGFAYNTQYGLIAIPGGDDTDGDYADLDTTGQGQVSGNTFTCNSCHTPHAVSGSTVAEYLGDSHVKYTDRNAGGPGKAFLFLTNRILKKVVNNQPAVTTYGSQWCINCHKGRHDEGVVLNHPVDESAPGYDYVQAGRNPFATLLDTTVHTNAYGAKYYLIDTSGTDPNANFDYDPRSNKWFAMEPNDPITGASRPDGNVSYAVGVGPGCLQCHGNPRDVDDGYFTGAWTPNGSNGGHAEEDGGAPSRYTFPHLSTNPALLVEKGDDFCTNCHGITNLP